MYISKGVCEGKRCCCVWTALGDKQKNKNKNAFAYVICVCVCVSSLGAIPLIITNTIMMVMISGFWVHCTNWNQTNRWAISFYGDDDGEECILVNSIFENEKSTSQPQKGVCYFSPVRKRWKDSTKALRFGKGSNSNDAITQTYKFSIIIESRIETVTLTLDLKRIDRLLSIAKQFGMQKLKQ